MLLEIEKAQQFGLMLATSRHFTGKSQKYMAQALGKSVTTIQNWESGIGEPTYRILEKWFSVLGLNMSYYIRCYQTNSNYHQTTDISNLKNQIHKYINTELTSFEIEQLAFCMFDNLHLPYTEQLNLLTAINVCKPMYNLHTFQMIYNNYQLFNHYNNLHDYTVLPNDNMLEHTLCECRNSVLKY